VFVRTKRNIIVFFVMKNVHCWEGWEEIIRYIFFFLLIKFETNNVSSLILVFLFYVTLLNATTMQDVILTERVLIYFQMYIMNPSTHNTTISSVFMERMNIIPFKLFIIFL
jgi:hypothetical protein